MQQKEGTWKFQDKADDNVLPNRYEKYRLLLKIVCSQSSLCTNEKVNRIIRRLILEHIKHYKRILSFKNSLFRTFIVLEHQSWNVPYWSIISFSCATKKKTTKNFTTDDNVLDTVAKSFVCFLKSFALNNFDARMKKQFESCMMHME